MKCHGEGGCYLQAHAPVTFTALARCRLAVFALIYSSLLHPSPPLPPSWHRWGAAHPVLAPLIGGQRGSRHIPVGDKELVAAWGQGEAGFGTGCRVHAGAWPEPPSPPCLHAGTQGCTPEHQTSVLQGPWHKGQVALGQGAAPCCLPSSPQ